MATFNPSLIIELTKRDFKERFAGSVLGSLWTMIWPLVSLFIYLVIFGKIMGARLPGTSDMDAYGIYLAVGLIPWTSFAGTINRSASVFLEKKNIISKVSTSLTSLVIQVNLSEVITYLLSMLFLFLFLIFKDHSFHRGLLLLPFIYYLQQLLAFTIGLFVAVLTVFIRDIREITSVITQLGFWFTPIVYVLDILPDFAKALVMYNPAYILINSYQKIFVFNEYPSFNSLIILTVITHCFLFLTYFMFRRLEKDIRDFL